MAEEIGFERELGMGAIVAVPLKPDKVVEGSTLPEMLFAVRFQGLVPMDEMGTSEIKVGVTVTFGPEDCVVPGTL
jgi:hypothetical protein